MSYIASASAVALFVVASALAAGCSATPADDDTDDQSDALGGAPGAEAEKAVAEYQKLVEAAYRAAVDADFEVLAGEKLPGEALRDFRTMSSACTDGRQVDAHKWTAKAIQASPTDKKLVSRTLFTVGARKGTATIVVGVYDTLGTFLLGLTFIDDKLVARAANDFQKEIKACAASVSGPRRDAPGTTCITPKGWCQAVRIGPPGAPCACSTAEGWVQGVLR